MRRWQQAKSGNGSVVLISGEPGIGKSRIAQAVLERLRGEPYAPLRYFCSLWVLPKKVVGEDCSAAFVAMMQATNLRESDNVPAAGGCIRARFRTILVKREMGSGLVMILKIRRQNPAQLALIEDDDVIETFAAD
jgi:hypothetical protein